MCACARVSSVAGLLCGLCSRHLSTSSSSSTDCGIQILQGQDAHGWAYTLKDSRTIDQLHASNHTRPQRNKHGGRIPPISEPGAAIACLSGGLPIPIRPPGSQFTVTRHPIASRLSSHHDRAAQNPGPVAGSRAPQHNQARQCTPGPRRALRRVPTLSQRDGSPQNVCLGLLLLV